MVNGDNYTRMTNYIAYTIAQVLTPFASTNYRPTWVGIGQLSFYVWAVVTFSFYVRKRIGKKAWRLIHFLSYASLVGAMIHGIFSGTDTPAAWTQYLYWFSGAATHSSTPAGWNDTVPET